MTNSGTDRLEKLYIAYRVYPRFSKSAFTEGFADKFDMFKNCIISFIVALGGIDYKIHFILDSCPPVYAEFIESLVHMERFSIEHLSNAGNRNTFLRQIEVLLNQTFSDNIFFAEDDYLYKQDTFLKIVNFLNSSNKADFVTPYDHPDYYMSISCTNRYLHTYKSRIEFYQGMHYRTVSSTTLTFLTSVKVLKETKKYFFRYMTKNLGDYQIWLMLTHVKRRTGWIKSTINLYLVDAFKVLFGKKYTLYAPLPGLAIHLAEPCAGKMGDIESFKLQQQFIEK